MSLAPRRGSLCPSIPENVRKGVAAKVEVIRKSTWRLRCRQDAQRLPRRQAVGYEPRLHDPPLLMAIDAVIVPMTSSKKRSFR
jgi:hypothetical protein